MADINALVDQLSALTVLEAAELSKALEEKWGVSAAAAIAVAPASAVAVATARLLSSSPPPLLPSLAPPLAAPPLRLKK